MAVKGDQIKLTDKPEFSEVQRNAITPIQIAGIEFFVLILSSRVTSNHFYFDEEAYHSFFFTFCSVDAYDAVSQLSDRVI